MSMCQISSSAISSPAWQPFLPPLITDNNITFAISLAVKSVELALLAVFNLYRTSIIIQPCTRRKSVAYLIYSIAAIVIVANGSSAIATTIMCFVSC
ncbi:hypothetical protein NECAME_11299 [Necator americanus]|uniref:Uncharacterized protein n=1 Tax=Necator americanus TaxID=51031 RepID=W2T7C4_NECAM|nr:hypothetical protein NECAME_11299 [Necator americanus]ETN77071.1 hypothetical protein NECAME_11299 [Necator americanus]